MCTLNQTIYHIDKFQKQCRRGAVQLCSEFFLKNSLEKIGIYFSNVTGAHNFSK